MFPLILTVEGKERRRRNADTEDDSDSVDLKYSSLAAVVLLFARMT